MYTSDVNNVQCKYMFAFHLNKTFRGVSCLSKLIDNSNSSSILES